MIYFNRNKTWNEWRYFIDCNTDGFEEIRSLKEIFCNNKLKVSEPTHLDAALLDHVYASASHLKTTDTLHR